MSANLAVAYHEAGHAAMAVHYKFGLWRVSIVPSHQFQGVCRTVKQPSFMQIDTYISGKMERRIEQKIMVALAGGIAQRIKVPHSYRHIHDRSDKEVAYGLALRVYGDMKLASAFLNYLTLRTEASLRNPGIWDGVEALAKELVISRQLPGKKASDIVRGV